MLRLVGAGSALLLLAGALIRLRSAWKNASRCCNNSARVITIILLSLKVALFPVIRSMSASIDPSMATPITFNTMIAPSTPESALSESATGPFITLEMNSLPAPAISSTTATTPAIGSTIRQPRSRCTSGSMVLPIVKAR